MTHENYLKFKSPCPYMLLEHKYTFFIFVCGYFHSTARSELSAEDKDHLAQESLKHLLADPLEKTFANPYFK